MISKNDEIYPGDRKLQSASFPPLPAGNYKVTACLTIDQIGNDNNNVSFSEEFQFTVASPGLSLDPGLICGVYPPEGSNGAYHNTLPHITFTRKTLPWERKIDTETNKNPWMALMLFSADEIKDNQIIFQNMNASDLKADNATILVPEINPENWELVNDDGSPARIYVVEMPTEFFGKIAPHADELHLLAHTRQVDTTGKADAGNNPAGWFSVVIGNRLPIQNEENTVCLVSLEQLPPVPFGPDEHREKIRLVVLKKWSFSESGATFEETGRELGKNSKPYSIDTPDFAKAPSEVNDKIQKAISYGYLPVRHDFRNGMSSVSWYRGPLVPVAATTAELYRYQSADEALRFDPDTGMFDISYAAAWQLGRLLALKNSGFINALTLWKSTFNQETNHLAAEEVLKDNSISMDKMSELVHQVESDEILTDLIIELWNNRDQH